MPLRFSRLPFYVKMSDLKEVGVENILRRHNTTSLEEVVRQAVDELSDQEEEVDLQCGQRIDDVVISDDEEQQPSCSRATEGSKRKLFKQSDSGFGKSSRSLKRSRLIPETASTPPKQKRQRNQKTLMDQPLVPADDSSIFAARMRSLMMTQSLMNIVSALQFPLTMIALSVIVEEIQLNLPPLTNMTQEAKTLLQTLVQEAIQYLTVNPGLQSLQNSTTIASDPTWSMTRSGIATTRTVIDWLNACAPKIQLQQPSQIPNTSNLSMQSSTIPSTALTTYTSFTIATGPPDAAPVPVSRGTTEATLSGGLLELARCRVKTGSRSSHIYVQDRDGSYKYVLDDTCGDHLLDLRVYPSKEIEKEEVKNWWRHSLIRGQIAVSSQPTDRPQDPIYAALQHLVQAIHQRFAADENTQVIPMPASKRSFD